MSAKLLAKMTASGIVLDSCSGSGGLVRICTEDIAAALGFGNLSTIAYYFARAKYCDDHDAVLKLLGYFEIWVQKKINEKKWIDSEGRARGLANLAILETIAQQKCKQCKGRACISKYQLIDEKRILVSEKCKRCNGSGEGNISERKKAEIAGISASSWIRTWAVRYENLVGCLLEYDEQVMYHLWRQLNQSDVA